MEQKTIPVPDKESQEQSKTDHISVKEKVNISSGTLINATYLILSILRLAHWSPDRLVQVIGIEKYPGEKDFALTDENIREWLLSHSIDLSKDAINQILELGYNNSVYAKRERKNKKGEIICTTWLTSG